MATDPGNPASIRRVFSSLVIPSTPQLVAGNEQPQTNRGNQHEEARGPRQAFDDADIGNAEESVAETVDEIKERIEMRSSEPERPQRMHRVEHDGQERRRGDQKDGARGEVVEFGGDNA